MWYSRGVARTVQARLDDGAERDLGILRNLGHTDSEAIRLALREAADRRRTKRALRREAAEAAADPEDCAEMQRVLAEMEAISPDLPEPE